MSVRVDADTVHLEGICPVEDAEPLLRALQDGARTIDLSRLSRAHMAVAQILAAARVDLVGCPDDEFVARLLVPALGDQGRQK